MIGGGQIYRELLPLCDKAYVTKVDRAFDADVYFPDLDQDPQWKMTKSRARNRRILTWNMSSRCMRGQHEDLKHNSTETIQHRKRGVSHGACEGIRQKGPLPGGGGGSTGKTRSACRRKWGSTRCIFRRKPFPIPSRGCRMECPIPAPGTVI